MRRENLHGNLAAVLDVFGKIHDSHRATAELAFDHVTSGQCGVDALHFTQS